MPDPYESETVHRETTDPADPARPAPVSRSYNRTAYTSVRSGNLAAWRLMQVVWWIAGVIDALIAIRFVLKLLGASTASGFVQFMYSITDPLVAPFHGIFNTASSGRSVLEPESIVAIIIYTLLAWGIVSLIRLLAGRGTGTAVVE
jgi:uncharacterized protein YggT (Ycf19 family)